MKDFTIFIENNEQMSKLVLITSNGQRTIERNTTYLVDGKIFKSSIDREDYNVDISLDNLKNFFNNQLNALISFYRVQGEFNVYIG